MSVPILLVIICLFSVQFTSAMEGDDYVLLDLSKKVVSPSSVELSAKPLSTLESEDKSFKSNIILSSSAWTEKDNRDAKFLWSFYRSMYKETGNLASTQNLKNIDKCSLYILKSIQDNPKILQSRAQKSARWTPLLGAVSFLKGYNMNQHMAIEIFKFDQDIDHRVEALCYAIRNGMINYVKSVCALKLENFTLKDSPELLEDVIKRCCTVQQTSGSFWASFISVGKPSNTESQDKICHFKVRDLEEQLKSLNMATSLINLGISFSKVTDNFPPNVHANSCLSCAYIRNKSLDQHERDIADL